MIFWFLEESSGFSVEFIFIYKMISYICFLAVVRDVHCLFYIGLVGHSKTNLETRIPDFCLMGAKYF